MNSSCDLQLRSLRPRTSYWGHVLQAYRLLEFAILRLLMSLGSIAGPAFRRLWSKERLYSDRKHHGLSL